jgi:regulator of PEP synthase PpsR (kinase-PPPase family)
MADTVDLTVRVVSDATGTTAEAVVRAALAQFPTVRPRFLRFSHVRTENRVRTILREATEPSIIVYSLVSERLRELVDRGCRKRSLDAFDVLGPLIANLAERLDMRPVSQPGLLQHSEEQSLRVARAIDFTLQHDDGLGLDSLGSADVLLLGVSRTSKTPTSVYLACNHTLKVANYPIIHEQPLPHEVTRSTPVKVGLTIDAERLVSLRRARIKDVPHYTDLAETQRELDFALGQMRRLRRMPILDVTNFSIEEIADTIVRLVADRRSGR